MKYLGDETTVEIVQKSIRKIQYIRCDKCGKKILPCNFRKEECSYIRIHTWHNDWGNDSVDSHEYGDYCKECAKEVIAEYINEATGTEELEFKHECLWKNEAHNGIGDGYTLVINDCHPTEKGGESDG